MITFNIVRCGTIDPHLWTSSQWRRENAPPLPSMIPLSTAITTRIGGMSLFKCVSDIKHHINVNRRTHLCVLLSCTYYCEKACGCQGRRGGGSSQKGSRMSSVLWLASHMRMKCMVGIIRHILRWRCRQPPPPVPPSTTQYTIEVQLLSNHVYIITR